MTEPTPLHGLWCATLTPLQRNGDIDQPKLVAHVQDLLSGVVKGVVLFGTTGEGPSLSLAERMSTLDALLTAGISPKALVAATGCAAFTDAVTLTRHALQSGCPRCLIMPPFFWRDLSEEAIFRYYATLIDTVGDARLRLYLYHMPQLTGVPIMPSVVSRLAAAYPDILAGVKDSGGDFSHTRELLKRAPQLAFLVGHEPHIPSLLRSGGSGTISGIANLIPEQVAALLRPTIDLGTGRQIQSFLEILLRYPFVPALKAIYASQTGDNNWQTVRPPLFCLSAGEMRDLCAALSKVGFDQFTKKSGMIV